MAVRRVVGVAKFANVPVPARHVMVSRGKAAVTVGAVGVGETTRQVTRPPAIVALPVQVSSSESGFLIKLTKRHSVPYLSISSKPRGPLRMGGQLPPLRSRMIRQPSVAQARRHPSHLGARICCLHPWGRIGDVADIEGQPGLVESQVERPDSAVVEAQDDVFWYGHRSRARTEWSVVTRTRFLRALLLTSLMDLGQVVVRRRARMLFTSFMQSEGVRGVSSSWRMTASFLVLIFGGDGVWGGLLARFRWFLLRWEITGWNAPPVTVAFA